jgi:hypothetical protein
MKEHSIKASEAQFIRLFRWIAGLEISSDAKLLFARLLDLADGEQNVKASRRFLRAWLCRLWKAEGNLEIFSASRRVAAIERQLQHLKENHQKSTQARKQI